jgi:hypothetical protein
VPVPSGLEPKVVDQEDERPALAAEAVAQRVEPHDRAPVQMHTMRCVEASRAGRRLQETARFLEFWIGQMSSVLERWRSEGRNN